MVGIQTPRPLDRAGAEYLGAAAVPVQREVVRQRARRVGRSEILQHAARRDGRAGHAEQTGRAGTVVEVRVPFVAQRADRQRRRLARGERGNACVPPQAHLAVGLRHRDRIRRSGVVVHEDGSAQRVFRPATVRRWAEAWVAPGSGPGGRRVDLGIRNGFLVGHERAVGRRRPIDAVLPAGLPEDFIAAEECQVDARISRGLDARPLTARPILVVAHRQEGLVVQQQAAGAVGVDPAGIAHVISVRLQPPHHRVLGVEHPVLPAIHGARVEGAVVAHLVGATYRQPCVEAVAAIVVVGLPGRVRCLEQHTGRAGVVAHDEHDMAGAASVGSDHLGKVDAGGGIGRHRPRSRHRPVAAVDQPGRRVVQATALRLRECCGGHNTGGDLAGAVAAVIPHAIDVEAIARRAGIDLE